LCTRRWPGLVGVFLVQYLTAARIDHEYRGGAGGGNMRKV
jgi:hypothetical protein